MRATGPCICPTRSPENTLLQRVRGIGSMSSSKRSKDPRSGVERRHHLSEKTRVQPDTSRRRLTK